MCGIVGYVGKDEAAPILLHGLQKLEYRGYDSAGIAVRYDTGEPIVVKAEGKLENLIEKTNDGKNLHSNCGIGHTRWATHGAVTYLLDESSNESIIYKNYSSLSHDFEYFLYNSFYAMEDKITCVE